MIKRMLWSMLCALVFAAVPGKALGAGLCCQVSSGSQESRLGHATEELGRPSLQLTYSFTFMDTIREGTTRRSLREVKEEGRYTSLPTEMGMTKYTLTVGYDFNRHITVMVSIPWIRNTMDMEMLMGMGPMKTWRDHVMDPVDGIGDITVMGLYHVYPRGNDNPSDILSFGVGLKTPTGSSTVKGPSGRFIHAHMQPGTGSWDPLLSVMYTRTSGRLQLQTDLTYQFATRNSHGYEFGDSFTAHVAGKFAAIDVCTVTAGFTYLHVGTASDRDGEYTKLTSLMDDPKNTGGDSIWFSPGVQLIPLKNGSIDAKLQIPVWERVNGIQLVSSYRVLLGISYRF